MSKKFNNINTIILTGGKSSRMGYDKSQLQFGETTLLEKTISLVSPHFADIILSVREKEAYPQLKLKKAVDICRGFGPIVGIYSSLLVSDTENNFIVSCDLPFINEELVLFIVDYPSDQQIKIPVFNNKVHPMCGVYTTNILPLLEKLLNQHISNNQIDNGKNKSLSMKNFFKIVSVEYIDIEKKFPGYNPELLFNINTMDDYYKAKRIIKNSQL
ncbi:MAG TPA: molybdenum cofactor guanylyltransferase [Ignavibacteriaceae bacterium]|nr:molybdenum cofactor guanylyltransferase [Ignavibacteriaceae bacterium]